MAASVMEDASSELDSQHRHLELTVRARVRQPRACSPVGREQESMVWPTNQRPKPDHGELDHAGHGELDPPVPPRHAQPRCSRFASSSIGEHLCVSSRWVGKMGTPFASAVGAWFGDAKPLYMTYFSFGSHFAYAVGDSLKKVYIISMLSTDSLQILKNTQS